MPEAIQSRKFNQTWTWETKNLCKDTQTKRSNKNRGPIKRQQRNPKSQSEHGRRRNIGRCQNRKLGTSQGSSENRHVAVLAKMQGTFVSGQYVVLKLENFGVGWMHHMWCNGCGHEFVDHIRESFMQVIPASWTNYGVPNLSLISMRLRNINPGKTWAGKVVREHIRSHKAGWIF